MEVWGWRDVGRGIVGSYACGADQDGGGWIFVRYSELMILVLLLFHAGPRGERNRGGEALPWRAGDGLDSIHTLGV